MLNPARLVFLDETAVSTNLVRLRGRTPRGVRLVGEVPLGSWETITFVVALRQNKMMALMVVKGAINGEMFLAYGSSAWFGSSGAMIALRWTTIRPTKSLASRRLIESAGATLRYLPKYLLDLNPIELPYGKLKT